MVAIMRFHEKFYGDVLTIALDGKLIGEPETTQLHNILSSAITAGKCKIVLDLQKVEWMGSIGFGIITGGLMYARSAGGDLRLTGLNKKVAKLLTITKLNCVFQTFESIHKAISSYAGESEISLIDNNDSVLIS